MVPGDLVARDGAGEEADLVRAQVGAADPAARRPGRPPRRDGLRLGRSPSSSSRCASTRVTARMRYMSPSCATMRSSSEMTAGSVRHVDDAADAAGDGALQRRAQLLEALDALAVSAERFGEPVVADTRERARDVTSWSEELVLLVADVTPAGVVRDDHDHGQLVADRGGHLHGGEPEGAVAGEEEDRAHRGALPARRGRTACRPRAFRARWSW